MYFVYEIYEIPRSPMDPGIILHHKYLPFPLCWAFEWFLYGNGHPWLWLFIFQMYFSPIYMYKICVSSFLLRYYYYSIMVVSVFPPLPSSVQSTLHCISSFVSYLFYTIFMLCIIIIFMYVNLLYLLQYL